MIAVLGQELLGPVAVEAEGVYNLAFQKSRRNEYPISAFLIIIFITTKVSHPMKTVLIRKIYIF